MSIMEVTVLQEKLCYNLEEAQDHIAKAIADHDDQNLSISLQRLGGYRLLTVVNNLAEPEPTSL